MIPEARTQPSIRRDFVEWHRGRQPYVFWALDVDVPAVADDVARHARLLGDALLEGYCRQPHVTLDVCGFPSRRPLYDDEFGPALLARQLAALRLARPEPFSIEIGEADSFLSAPYLTVRDTEGGIGALRRCLAIDGAHRLLGDYVPHVTIGLYARSLLFSEVRARLLAGRCDGLVFPVARLSLMGYAPAEIGGRLERLADYELASGDWRWRDAAPLDALDFLRAGAPES